MFRLAPLPRTLEAAERDAGHARESVRRSAVRDLARHAERKESSAIAALVRLLGRDPSAEVRCDAALALADAQASGAVGGLLEALTDSDPRVRQMAIVALGELAGEIDPALRDRLREELERLVCGEAPALRYQALIAWCQVFEEDALPRLEAAFQDPDAEVRHIALRLAEERWLPAETLTEEARRACLRALSDEAARVRGVAAIILGRTGSDAGRAEIARIVGGSEPEEPEDIQTAIELAADLGITEAAPALTRRAFGGVITSQDAFSWHARIALARLGSRRARAAILRGLTSWSRHARTMSVVAAGRAGVSEATTLLVAMRGDPGRAEPSAVDEALELLGQLDRETQENPSV